MVAMEAQETLQVYIILSNRHFFLMSIGEWWINKVLVFMKTLFGLKGFEKNRWRGREEGEKEERGEEGGVEKPLSSRSHHLPLFLHLPFSPLLAKGEEGK